MNKATAPRFPCLAGQRGETAYSLAFEFPRFTSRNKPDAFRIRKYVANIVKAERRAKPERTCILNEACPYTVGKDQPPCKYS